MTFNFSRTTLRTLPVLLLASCSVGPDYQRPEVTLPSTFKEAEGWAQTNPQEIPLSQQPWWGVFQDDTLANLMAQVEVGNESLKAAVSVYRQAALQISAAREAYFPTISASAGYARGRQGLDPISKEFNVKGSVDWQLDLWGRNRRTVESLDAGARASAADLAATRLSLQAALAEAYFQLRSNDALIHLYDETIKTYEASLTFVQNQYSAGVVAKSDVAQAIVQLRTAQAQRADLEITRRTSEHTVALLVGKTPAELNIDDVPLSTVDVQVPPGLPMNLLQRRPDVAAAERRVAQANAQIGVYVAPYFPSLTIDAAGGYQNSVLNKLISTPNLFWSVGPNLALSLFDPARGLRKDLAYEAREQSIHQYRQTVLVAVGEVEDQLATLNALLKEIQWQQEAQDAALQAVTIGRNQYQAGILNFLSLAVLEANSLNAARALVSLQNRRYAALINLITAIGGGWEGADKEIENQQQHKQQEQEKKP